MGSRGLPCLVVAWQDFLDHLGEGAAELEPFGPGLQLSAELVAAGLIHRELPAVLDSSRHSP